MRCRVRVSRARSAALDRRRGGAWCACSAAGSPARRPAGRSRTVEPHATRHVGRRCYLTEQPALGKTNLVKSRFGSSPSVATARGFGSDEQRQSHIQPVAGTLPGSATSLSNAARGLLMRLLERDPRVRIRNLRQLQQSAFYMKFNFEHVKSKKISPKSVLERFYPNGVSSADNLRMTTQKMFSSFDQPSLI